MIWVYLENWSQPYVIERLDTLRFPHTGRVIKVFACDSDPRDVFDNSRLFVEQVSDEIFQPNDKYLFGKRRWNGSDLEAYVNEMSVVGNRRAARGLFRFSLTHGFTQAAMNLTTLGEARISHPMDVLHGWGHKSQPKMLHLDIFLPKSVQTIQRLVGENLADSTVNWMVGTKWRLKK